MQQCLNARPCPRTYSYNHTNDVDTYADTVTAELKTRTERLIGHLEKNGFSKEAAQVREFQGHLSSQLEPYIKCRCYKECGGLRSATALEQSLTGYEKWLDTFEEKNLKAVHGTKALPGGVLQRDLANKYLNDTFEKSGAAAVRTNDGRYALDLPNNWQVKILGRDGRVVYDSARPESEKLSISGARYRHFFAAEEGVSLVVSRPEKPIIKLEGKFAPGSEGQLTFPAVPIPVPEPMKEPVRIKLPPTAPERRYSEPPVKALEKTGETKPTVKQPEKPPAQPAVKKPEPTPDLSRIDISTLKRKLTDAAMELARASAIPEEKRTNRLANRYQSGFFAFKPDELRQRFTPVEIAALNDPAVFAKLQEPFKFPSAAHIFPRAFEKNGERSIGIFVANYMDVHSGMTRENGGGIRIQAAFEGMPLQDHLDYRPVISPLTPVRITYPKSPSDWANKGTAVLRHNGDVLYTWKESGTEKALFYVPVETKNGILYESRDAVRLNGNWTQKS